MKEQEVILTEEDLERLNESNDDEGGWGVPKKELEKTAKSVKKNDGLALQLRHVKKISTLVTLASFRVLIQHKTENRLDKSDYNNSL